MSTAYRWVEPPWPNAELPRDQLEDRIQQLLGSTNMCVMATVGGKGQPIASPIEYYADGLDLYMLPDPGTPKLKALQVTVGQKLGLQGPAASSSAASKAAKPVAKASAPSAKAPAPAASK